MFITSARASRCFVKTSAVLTKAKNETRIFTGVYGNGICGLRIDRSYR
jgi:hypothetical protein